jgi:uncharacterized protein YndB with AHSA1/START domain
MRKPVKILLIVIAAIVALVAVVTIAGLMLPRTHSATSEVTLKQPIDSVFAAVRDIGGLPKWWSGVTASERVTGAPGERWKQVGGGNTMQIDVVNVTPPTGFTTKIVEEKGAPFGGAWVYALKPAQDGTTVTITENGWIGPPPFRVIMKLMGSHRTMDGMLAALGKRFGEAVTPVHK